MGLKNHCMNNIVMEIIKNSFLRSAQISFLLQLPYMKKIPLSESISCYWFVFNHFLWQLSNNECI